jgi:hypothetical protein
VKSDEFTVNGVRIQGAPEPERSQMRRFVLPSGRSAAIRKGIGRDLMRAQRVAGPSADAAAVVFALIAELVEIDGNKIVYEDVLVMDLEDVFALQCEVAGGNFQAPPPAPSPHSSILDSD